MVKHSLGKDSCVQRDILQYTMQDRPESRDHNLLYSCVMKTCLCPFIKTTISLDKLLPRYFQLLCEVSLCLYRHALRCLRYDFHNQYYKVGADNPEATVHSKVVNKLPNLCNTYSATQLIQYICETAGVTGHKNDKFGL